MAIELSEAELSEGHDVLLYMPEVRDRSLATILNHSIYWFAGILAYIRENCQGRFAYLSDPEIGTARFRFENVSDAVMVKLRFG